MLTVEVENLRAVGRALTASETQIELAMTRTIIRASVWVRKGIAVQIARDHKIAEGTAMKLVDITRRPSKGDLTATIATQKIMGSYRLGKARKTQGGVSVAGRSYKGAFMARMPNGMIGIFKRKTKKRLPIQRRYVVLGNSAEKFMAEHKGKLEEYIAQCFDRELRSIRS